MKKFAVYETEIGYLKFIYEKETLYEIKLMKKEEVQELGEKNLFTENIFRQFQEYFLGKRKEFNIDYKLEGTEFQKKVWNALKEIPYGETRCYQEVAESVKSPKACRAVGLANNKNPLMILIPCHRVIGKNKKLVGYAGGLDIKIKLLELEKNNRN